MRAFCYVFLAFAACDPSAPVDEGAPRPDADVLRFDAAMLGDARDASEPLPSVDGGRDSGRDAGRDAGRPPSRDAGPPPRRYVCRGIPTSCGLLSSYRCADQLGCRESSECTGSARSCYSIYSSYSCSAQDGCFWSSYSDYCSGSARSCRLYTGSSSCIGQDGCRWTDSCDGVAWGCDGFFTSSSCFGQSGCRWEEE